MSFNITNNNSLNNPNHDLPYQEDLEHQEFINRYGYRQVAPFPLLGEYIQRIAQENFRLIQELGSSSTRLPPAPPYDAPHLLPALPIQRNQHVQINNQPVLVIHPQMNPPQTQHPAPGPVSSQRVSRSAREIESAGPRLVFHNLHHSPNRPTPILEEKLMKQQNHRLIEQMRLKLFEGTASPKCFNSETTRSSFAEASKSAHVIEFVLNYLNQEAPRLDLKEVNEMTSSHFRKKIAIDNTTEVLKKMNALYGRNFTCQGQDAPLVIKTHNECLTFLLNELNKANS